MERVPEGDDAQRRMRRLRRRIRLLYAGCPEGPIRMTVVRRELPLSKGASHPAGYSGRRIVSARALQSCPHRADAAAPQETEHQLPSLGDPVDQQFISVPTPGGHLRGRSLSHRRPEEAHQFSRDRHHRDRWPFAPPDQMAVAAMQPLLGAPGAWPTTWGGWSAVRRRRTPLTEGW